MAHQKRFRFALKKDPTTFYYENRGVLFTSPTPRYIKRSPANWKNTKATFLRNTRYWGVFREISVAYQFVQDSAFILREIYHSESFEGSCILYIEKWNTTTLQFEFFYEGDLNFSSRIDERNFFTINILDRGLPALLKSREDTPYEIPLDDPDALEILIDGVKVGGSGDWYPGNYSSEAANGVRFSSIPYTSSGAITGGRSVNLTGGVNVNQISSFIRPHDQPSGLAGATGNLKALVQYAYNPGTPTPQDGEYILYANTDLYDVTLSGQMVVSTHLPDLVGTKRIRVIASVVDLGAPGFGAVSQTTLFTYTSAGQDIDVGFTATMNGVFDMPQGTYLLITITGDTPLWAGGPDPEAFFPIENGYLNVRFLAKIAPTTTKGFRIIDLAKKLIGQLTDGQYTAISNYLSNQDTSDAYRKSQWDSLAYNTVITCGDSLRGLSNAVIKITLSDFYAFLWANYCQAMMVKDTGVHFEYIRDAFSEEVIYTLEAVNGISVTTFNEVIANQYKVGYQNFDTENITGKNEFNTGTVFLQDSILRATKKEDTRISPVRFDVYGIEQTRAQNFNQDRKDYKADNNNFGIEIDPTPVSGQYVPFRPSPSYITGVDDPEDIYNVTQSPFRKVGLALPFIRSVKPSGNLVFQTTDKNPELVSDLYSATPTADTISEIETIPLEADVFKGRDVSRIFTPDIINFNAVCKINFYNLARENPYGLVQFWNNGYLFKGWILEAGIDAATFDVYPTKLINHPNNDLRKLKHA